MIERLESRVLLNAGLPDPSFGTNGVVTTTFGAGQQGAYLRGLALQPDGKILAFGDIFENSLQNFSVHAALVRYTPAGALDDSFGQGGIVFVPSPVNGHNLAVQPDGKILVSTRGSVPTELELLRYTASGLPDSSFGIGGQVATDVWAASIAVRPDGRIVLAGVNGQNSVTELASFLPNGVPDQNFGVGGKVLISVGPAASGLAAMTLQADGKIDFAGTYNGGATGTYAGDWYLARLNADGTPDSSFGAGGTVVADFGGPYDDATALTCESDGDIIVAGDAAVGGVRSAALAFFTPSGALDLSRGTAGKVTTSFDSSHSASARAVAVQPADGKIVVAADVAFGADFGIASEESWGLARYTPAGKLDHTFGTGGISLSNRVAITDPFRGTYVAGMALEDDGKIVVGGTPFSGHVVQLGNFVVARYLGDGGTLVSTPFSGQPVSVPAAAVEAKNFDNGGEGVAYHDTTPQNIGGAYRNSFVDVLSVAGASNGYAVGYTDVGEWLKYTINVTTAGTYTLQSRVASDLPGGTFHIELDGSNVTGTMNVPDTGGWMYWQTLTSRPFTLSLGSHVMRLVEDTTGTLGAVANFDTFRFAALPGLPDPSFGINGVVTTNLAGLQAASVAGVALQPDGKTVVTGAFYENYSWPFDTVGVLLRYTPTGALDNNFGQGGIVFVSGGTSGNAIAVQPDGKILVAAYISGPNTIALFRYTASGLPDSSFGGGGEVVTDVRDPNIALRPDGRIVLAGHAIVNNANHTELASYLSDGQPDPSFGTGGKVLIIAGPAAYGVTPMILQPDGKIDFVGTYNSAVAGTEIQDVRLTRLNANGTPDSSFGTGGTVVTDFDSATALTRENDGDIIVAGTVTAGDLITPTLAFYTSSGALDLSRGSAGEVIISLGFPAAPVALAVQPRDGKIILAADVSVNYANGVYGEEFWGLARYTPAGKPDPTFGTGGYSLSNGLTYVPSNPYRRTRVTGMALQDDGKIVLAGFPSVGHYYAKADFVVARYLGDAGPRVSSPFSGQPIPVPATTIEAENFDTGGEGVAYHDTTPQNLGGAYRNSFVDLKALAGASNGYAVGYTDAGEWLKYTINVTTAGTYTLQSRVASYLPGGAFHVEVDGTNVTGTMTVPDTGGWSNWQTLTSRPFTLSSGNHVVRLVEDRTGTLGAVANFDTLRFALSESAGRVGIWDPQTRTFYLDTNNNGIPDKLGDTTVPWNNAAPTMIPVTGDWSAGGHGKYTGLFDRATAAWYLDMNENNVALDPGDVVYARYGNTGDLPVVGDWTGTGKTKIGVWRPSQNSFTLDLNGDGAWQSGTDRWFQISLPFNPSDTYTPIAGDFNGDGKTQLGFFDSTTQTWYLDQNQVTDATHAFSKLTFGNSWDQPLVGRWNTAFAFSQVGTWRPSDSTIRLDFNADGVFNPGDRSYPGWGLAINDVPVAI